MKATHPFKINTVFLATGCNLGDRKAKLYQAEQCVHTGIGEIVAISSIYETAPWGNTEQPDFYNQVMKVETALTASQVMKKILSIEAEMGRIRTFRYAPREIDIDILFFNEEIIKRKNLVIPHPFLHRRNFVLAPLLEIAPDFVHPVFQESVHHLAEHCDDLLRVKKLGIV